MRRYNDFASYLRHRFGCRVQKISLDAGLTCPNRDGAKGWGGCIYCNQRGSGTGAAALGLSVGQQMVRGREYLRRRFRARKFLAYFQSYSNTYAPAPRLAAMFDEALAYDDVVGLCVATRPDCVDAEVLDLLQGYAAEHMVWVEYGLQSAHDRTLGLINRGHTFQDFLTALELTAGRRLKTCVHVILGLPGEEPQDMMATAKTLAALPIDAVKLHLLYVLKGTRLEPLYLSGGYTPLSQAAYVDLVLDFLERLPFHVVVQRLTGDPDPRELLAPEWAASKRDTLSLLARRAEERNFWQGKLAASGQAAMT
ncbi:MAG: TIGR01212 family radical SAM protein [Pseudomonadota bacterium]